jgi:molybdopterin synthase catalytic subunit
MLGGPGRRCVVLMNQSSQDHTLLGVRPSPGPDRGAVSRQSSQDKHRKRSLPGSTVRREGRAISTAQPDTAALVLRAAVGEEPLDVSEHAALVDGPRSGAVVTFSGVVRDHDHGRSVRTLDYEGHPSAGAVVERVAAEVAGRHPGVTAVAVSHRVGALAIGDVALACAVAAEHRREAFDACSELVDEVKRQLPVWKRQEFADGTEEWVNCP